MQRLYGVLIQRQHITRYAAGQEVSQNTEEQSQIFNQIALWRSGGELSTTGVTNIQYVMLFKTFIVKFNIVERL